MEYKFLGKTGVKVSELDLGTQTFGWCTDEKTAHSMMDMFVDHGGNFFDTADVYNQGKSEEILGSWLAARGNRDSLFIGSKVYFPVGEGPNDTGGSRKHIFDAVDKSLKRLRTDYLDLYQAHCYDAATPIEETLEALNDLVRSGKVRYIGASNYMASTLQKALMISEKQRFSRYVTLQPEYSLIVRATEWELLPLCREEGLGVLAWSPLAGGWLTGKYKRGKELPPDSRAGRKDRWDDQAEQRAGELTWRVLDALESVAAATGKSIPQIALNWLLQQPGLTAPVIGARTPQQLEDNLGSTGWKLDAEHMQVLDQASAIPKPYPYRFVDRYTRKR